MKPWKAICIVHNLYETLCGERSALCISLSVISRFRVLPLPCDCEFVSLQQRYTSAGLQRLSHSSLCFSFYFMYVLLFYLYPKVNVIQNDSQSAFQQWIDVQFIDYKHILGKQLTCLGKLFIYLYLQVYEIWLNVFSCSWMPRHSLTAILCIKIDVEMQFTFLVQNH